VTYFEHALAALDHLPERRETLEQAVDLRIELRGALLMLAEHARIREHLREAEAIAERLGDRRRLARILVYGVFYLHHAGDHAGALEAGRRIVAMRGDDDDPVLRIHPSFVTARAYAALGEYRRAVEVLGEVAVYLQGDLLHERFGMPAYPAANARSLLASYLTELGDFAEAGARGEEAVRIGEAVDHPYTLTIALMGLGDVCLRRGDLPRATETLERARELCRAWDLLQLTPLVTARLGATFTLAARLDEAVRLLEEAVQHEAQALYAEGPLHRHWLAEAYLPMGRVQDAFCDARRALDLVVERKERGRQAYVLRTLGAIAAEREPAEIQEAEGHFDRALALAEELGMRPLQARCHLGLGKLYRRAGRTDQARAELSTAVTMLREMGMTFWLPEAEADLAEVTASASSPSTG
jgi:tetratricopeptide (TPR) repeat protein